MPVDGGGGGVRAKRAGVPGQPVVAGAVLLPLRAWRAVPVPRRAERRDEALTPTHRRRDDGRLVSVDRIRQQARRLRGGILQLDAAAAVVHQRRCRVAHHSRGDVHSCEADQTTHVGGALKQWHSKSTARNATSRRVPSLPGTRSSPPSARGKPRASSRVSSACRSILPAICITTFDSNTTAYCSRGPCRKDQRWIQQQNGSQ